MGRLILLEEGEPERACYRGGKEEDGTGHGWNGRRRGRKGEMSLGTRNGMEPKSVERWNKGYITK